MNANRSAIQRPARALLTIREVAELDGCSEKTIRRAITAGLLEAVRLGPSGRLVRIDPAAHAAYRATFRS